MQGKMVPLAALYLSKPFCGFLVSVSSRALFRNQLDCSVIDTDESIGLLRPFFVVETVCGKACSTRYVMTMMAAKKEIISGRVAQIPFLGNGRWLGGLRFTTIESSVSHPVAVARTFIVIRSTSN